MRLRIVVASEGEAFFYDTARFGPPLEPAGHWVDPKARLHDRDFNSDRPGRVFDHAASGGRRGSVAHHSTGGENRPRKREAALFARQLATQLSQERLLNRFDSLLLVAGPPFLGVLRKACPKSLQAAIVAEIPKNLVHERESVLHAHLQRSALRPWAGERP